MAAHVDHPAPKPTAGSALLPVFAFAVVMATVAIGFVIAAPSTATLVIALASVIGFATGIVAVLSRLIGPDEH